jgi:hypothetical protein
MERRHRPFDAVEQRYLRIILAELVALRTKWRLRFIAICGAIVAIYAFLFFNGNWGGRVVLLVCAPLVFWPPRSVFRPINQRIAETEGVIRGNAVAFRDIRSHRVVILEDVPDRGSCYAFEICPDRIALICGREETARFPSNDFSIVTFLGENNDVYEELIRNRGGKLDPVRRIFGERVARLVLPVDDVSELAGRLEDLESLLSRST